MSAAKPFWWYAQQINGIHWPSQGTLTGILFNPVEQTTDLWLEVRDESVHLKQRIAELEAQLTQE